MNYTKLPKKVLLLLATPVLLSLAVPASRLVAQSQTETKIRLMAEALRARDSGDLNTAKVNLEQLLVLAPNDVTVQRLLSGVNDSLAKGAVAAEVATPSSPSSESLPVVVYDPNKPAVIATAAPAEVAVETPAVPAADAATTEAAAPAEVAAEAPDAQAAELAKAEETRVKGLLAAVKADRKLANRLAKDGDFDGAAAKLDASAASLPVNTLTQGTLAEIEQQKNDLLLQKSQVLLKEGDTKGAKAALDAYIAATSPESKAAKKQAAKIDSTEFDPPSPSIKEVSPDFIAEQKDVAKLAAQGRAQYAVGAIDEAQETFRTVETISADNPEAKYFLKRIADDKARLGTLNREKTRSQMIEEVAKGWQRPGVFIERAVETVDPTKVVDATVLQKLNTIIIPVISFSGQELGSVISTLSSLSEEFDTSAGTTKGVNLVLNNPLSGAPAPRVNITLRNLSLKRVLDIITQSVGYQYDIEADLVLVRPTGTDVNLSTEEFAVTKSAVTRMTGVGAAGTSTPAASADPFAPAPVSGGGGSSGGGEADSIKRFLSAAGVPFDSVPNASLAYDGSRILVTHTSRNIERIRNILARYNDIRQVEIEAKFLDVSEGALDELGLAFQTQFTEGGSDYTFNSGNRSLGSAFTSSGSGSSSGSIVIPGGVGNQTIPIPNAPPSLPGTVDLGASAANLATFTGVLGDISVEAQLRAISRRQGSDLLSAPKVTVLSGNRATITVAQELRYPQSYGEIQSEVGTSSGTTGGGSAGVTITAGTPQDFTSRNVGVELGVTPTVEEDDYSISLELNPRVTEFEGFVEYGGQSVAISSGATVTVPSGFFQPIFSVREINTRVTVWDGATLVMGGLTREEVRRVNDKVPVLGDIPFLGRAFKSKGEASQKRNLLVFVTANLVSPGGSLKKQKLKGVEPSSLFQNPTVVTPGGSESRVRTTSQE